MYRSMLTSAGATLALIATVAAAPAQMADGPLVPMTDNYETTTTEKDIVEVATAAGTFNTLLAAATAADLVDALKSDGPLTVFAPTDEAFAKLPAGTVETLLKPENKEKLRAVLLYHVVEGKVTAEQVVKLTSAKTLEGDSVDISVKMGKVYIDDAQVIAADVEASNGIIHVIDAVILPSMD
jgi:transforming growth factor-beta-induced protein